MKYQSKSIKTVLNNHKDEIYSLCENPAQFSALHKKVLEILNSDELKKNKSVPDAINILNSCSHNYNRYLSTLVTYMTGMKVSI